MLRPTSALREINFDGPRVGLLPEYQTYRSPHSPPYKVQQNFKGITLRHVTGFGLTAGLFAGALGFGALFFISDVPRVRHDIMQKLPFIGDYYKREVPADENPF